MTTKVPIVWIVTQVCGEITGQSSGIFSASSSTEQLLHFIFHMENSHEVTGLALRSLKK